MKTDGERRLAVEQAPTCDKSEDAPSVVFFSAVHRAFEEAERVAGSVICSYVIGGYSIQLRFAGPALVPFITPALEHLAERTDRPPSLTVCLVDSASTHTELPLPPWKGVDYTSGGNMWRLLREQFKVLFEPDAGILDVLDSEKNLAIYWVRSCHDLRFYEKASPLRTLLYWWMREHDRQMVHSAATGTPTGGVLIGGKGGSGKTTTSLVCLDSGLLYAGDNYILLSQESAPVAHSVYSSCTLHSQHMLTRLPWLAAKASNPDKLGVEKALVFVHEHYPESVATSVAVKAILMPEVTGQRATKLRSISPAQCLALFAPSSIFNLPAAGPEDFRYIARFVKRVPSYVLELGADLSAIPDLVKGLLSSPSVST